MPKTKIKMHLTQTAATRLYFDNEDNKLKIQKLEDLVENNSDRKTVYVPSLVFLCSGIDRSCEN